MDSAAEAPLAFWMPGLLCIRNNGDVVSSGVSIGGVQNINFTNVFSCFCRCNGLSKQVYCFTCQ